MAKEFSLLLKIGGIGVGIAVLIIGIINTIIVPKLFVSDIIAGALLIAAVFLFSFAKQRSGFKYMELLFAAAYGVLMYFMWVPRSIFTIDPVAGSLSIVLDIIIILYVLIVISVLIRLF